MLNIQILYITYHNRLKLTWPANHAHATLLNNIKYIKRTWEYDGLIHVNDVWKPLGLKTSTMWNSNVQNEGTTSALKGPDWIRPFHFIITAGRENSDYTASR